MEWGQNWEPDISIDAFMRGEISFWRFSRLLQEVYQGEGAAGTAPDGKTFGIRTSENTGCSFVGTGGDLYSQR